MEAKQKPRGNGSVAPLTRGGIIGNHGSSLAPAGTAGGRPSNQGRNHWKPGSFAKNKRSTRPGRPSNQGRNHWKQLYNYTTDILTTTTNSRPSNQGRNHWKQRTGSRAGFLHCLRVAPLTRGGIIGNAACRFGELPHGLVAPLTRGGIIGNQSSPTEIEERESVAPLTRGGIIGNLFSFPLSIV